MYTIGRLARRAKVNADSIRFYERQGLLAPETKTDSGYRLYTDEAVRRIAFVKGAQQCGFSLAEIRELLHMDDGDPSAKLKGYNLATQKQAEIQKKLEALQAMDEALSYLLDSRDDEAAPAPRRFEDSPLFAVFEARQSKNENVNRGSARSAETRAS